MLYEFHRALGASLVVLLVWKQGIARASLRRRLRWPRLDRSLALGALAAAGLLATAGLGLAWTLGLVSFDTFAGYSALNVHVFAGLGLGAAMLAHLALRWRRPPRAGSLASRRAFLHLAALGALSFVVWRSLESAGAAAAGAARRLTGSKHARSFSGNDFPYTTWLFDQVPTLDAATWSLEVTGAVARPTRLSYADLRSLQRRAVTAVLDCTGGWWTEQVWEGVAMSDALAAARPLPEARWATIVSVTGHRWSFPLEELANAIIATHVGGEVLDRGHGYPARLVAPGRRGFQWVKWVGRVELS